MLTMLLISYSYLTSLTGNAPHPGVILRRPKLYGVSHLAKRPRQTCKDLGNFKENGPTLNFANLRFCSTFLSASWSPAFSLLIWHQQSPPQSKRFRRRPRREMLGPGCSSLQREHYSNVIATSRAAPSTALATTWLNHSPGNERDCCYHTLFLFPFSSVVASQLASPGFEKDVARSLRGFVLSVSHRFWNLWLNIVGALC